MEAGETGHRADLWERGQVGGQTVGAALEGLREQGYDVLHDVRWPGRRRAKIDHVAVGPAGVLVVDAQHWSGVVAAHHGRLRQNGHRRDKELAGVLRSAVDVAALLPAASADCVVSVLCLAGEHQIAPTRCAGVTVVDVSRLTDWVSGLAPCLSPAAVSDLAGRLRRELPPVSSPAPRPAPPATATPANEPVAPAWPPFSTSTVAPRRRGLATIGLLVAALVVLPAVAYWWSANGSGVMSAMFPAAVPSVAAVAPVSPAFASCRELRAAHPGGIASPGAENTGRKLRRAVVVTTSRALYAANAGLDSDGDRIACEVVRKHHRNR